MNIVKFIQNLQPDKEDHALLGLYYAMYLIPAMILGYFAGKLFLSNAILGMDLGFSLVFGIATLSILWKEIAHDWLKGLGKPEFWDFASNMVALLIVGVVYLFLRIVLV